MKQYRCICYSRNPYNQEKIDTILVVRAATELYARLAALRELMQANLGWYHYVLEVREESAVKAALR